MTPERRQQLLWRGVSFDVETHLIQPGLLAPPIVCASIAVHDGTRIVGELLDKEAALLAFRQIIEDPDRIMVGANISFDVLVCAVEWARRGVDMMPAIFQAYEDGRVYDVLVGEALNAIADGTLNKDPRTGGDLRDPITRDAKNRYSLAIAVDLTLDRVDAKANDEWRLRYAELEHVPIDEWPQSARDYPVDDVVNAMQVALAQCGHLPKRAEHRWREDDTCDQCGARLSYGGPTASCRVTKSHRNLHSMSDQVYTAWALHLGAAWGFNVDQSAVDAIETEVTEKRARIAAPLFALGLLKWTTKENEHGGKDEVLGRDTPVIARLMAQAYGATGECSTCRGTAKVVSPKAKLIKCKTCRGGGVAPTGGPCTKCNGGGRQVSDAKSSQINCQDCRTTGLDLSTAPQLPITEPSDKFPNGQVQASRDVLFESGDETLGELAQWLEDAKVIGTYIPFLRKARVECAGPDGEVFFKSRPLTLKPNVLLETDRTSYEDAIQQFPRKGRLRTCIRARSGYRFASVDWNMGESITHAQSCRWILGYSDLGDALNRGLDPHASLAAEILGLSYEEFMHQLKVLKDPQAKDTRQGAKPFTFGKPTGIGSPKLVTQARMQGEDTPCENGPVILADGRRGYKGTRFCVLGGADRCGVHPDGTSNKVTSWGRPGYERDCKPLCRACLECADRFGEKWLKLWRENKPYFKYAKDASEFGQKISREVAEFLGVDGDRLAPGEMLQHVSGIIRGDVGFTDCANGWFQSLLAFCAKLALRCAQRECCDSSVIVPSDACEGGVVSAYAGQRSPLYGSRCVVLYHDELFAELIASMAHDGATRLSEIMVRTLQEICADQTPAIKAPPALMMVWHKGAEEKRDEDGRLIPWEPS